MKTGRIGSAMLGARAAVFAVVSTALAAGAHEMAGGARAGRWVLLGALVAMVEVGLLAGRRERRFVVLLGGLAATQAGLHLYLDIAAPLVHVSGHVEAGRVSPPMLLAHAAATLAVAAWLRRGEAALWRLARASAVRLLPVLPVAVAAVTPAPRQPSPAPLWAPHPRAGLAGEVCRRGPPLLLIACGR